MTVWPIINYGSRIRGFEGGADERFAPSISIPRPKYTWFMVMNIQPDAIQGNYMDGVRSGKILAALKSIDHPKFTFNVEKLRSYNNVRLIPTKMEYKPLSVQFFDDTTSYIADLIKNYRRFYSYSGDAKSYAEFGDGVGSDARSGSLPSMGMKVRQTGRHFFESIDLYDLGTEPSSVNVYHFINPTIVDLERDNLDYEDRDGKVGITFSMEYEGYWEEIGKEVTDYNYIFQQIGKGSNSETLGQLPDRGGIGSSPDIFGGILNGAIENIIENAPEILSDVFANGEFNSDVLKDQIFKHGAKGTPIQDVRNIIRDVKRAEQAGEVGNPVGVIGAGRRAQETAGNLGKIIFGTSGTAQEPSSTSPTSTKSASDRMRDTSWIILDEF